MKNKNWDKIEREFDKHRNQRQEFVDIVKKVNKQSCNNYDWDCGRYYACQEILKELNNKYMENNLKSEIYNLVDSFLVEVKNQDGEDRSLERLNQDRHLFVHNLMDILKKEFELLVAINNREKANNYIKEYLI